MLLRQDVEQGHGEPEPHFEIGPDAMHDLLEMAHITSGASAYRVKTTIYCG